MTGAVKLGALLPWQYDSDVYFSETNRTAVDKILIPSLQLYGLILNPVWSRQASECVDNKYKPCYTLSIPNTQSKLELYSSTTLFFTDIGFRQSRKLAQTKIFIDGVWIPSPYNPGHSLYSEYGELFYRHLGYESIFRNISLTPKYKHVNSRFLSKCRNPVGGQVCLDQLNPDGNIQFRDPH